MSEILICTHDNMLVKSLLNPLRDMGYSVTTADHAAMAIKLMMERYFSAVLIDSLVVGLSAGEAVRVMRRVSPETKTIIVGGMVAEFDAWSVSRTACLEEIRGILQGACERI